MRQEVTCRKCRRKQPRVGLLQDMDEVHGLKQSRIHALATRKLPQDASPQALQHLFTWPAVYCKQLRQAEIHPRDVMARSIVSMKGSALVCSLPRASHTC